MLTEAELQKQWERLTFTDDFIFSRVMRNKRFTKKHHPPKGRRSLPKRCWGSRSLLPADQ